MTFLDAWTWPKTVALGIILVAAIVWPELFARGWAGFLELVRIVVAAGQAVIPGGAS